MKRLKLEALTICLLSASVLLACGKQVKLSDQARKVKEISPEIAKKCDYQGLVSSSMPTDAVDDVKNKAANAGGNAILVVKKFGIPGMTKSSRVSAEVYRCDFQANLSNRKYVRN